MKSPTSSQPLVLACSGDDESHPNGALLESLPLYPGATLVQEFQYVLAGQIVLVRPGESFLLGVSEGEPAGPAKPGRAGRPGTTPTAACHSANQTTRGLDRMSFSAPGRTAFGGRLGRTIS